MANADANELSEIDLDIKEITGNLENDSMKKFVRSYDKLIESIKTKSTLNFKTKDQTHE